jgi:hypothetical protein
MMGLRWGKGRRPPLEPPRGEDGNNRLGVPGIKPDKGGLRRIKGIKSD